MKFMKPMKFFPQAFMSFMPFMVSQLLSRPTRI
jgi:hypothetical protein